MVKSTFKLTQLVHFLGEFQFKHRCGKEGLEGIGLKSVDLISDTSLQE